MSFRGSILGAVLMVAATTQAQEFKCASFQGKAPLFNAAVFDGPAAGNAELAPDVSKGKTSYSYASWDIGYLFGMGRTPFVVCKFAGLPDAQAVTIKIDKTVQKCVFRAHGSGQPAEMFCK